jgi:hypothetical protein
MERVRQAVGRREPVDDPGFRLLQMGCEALGKDTGQAKFRKSKEIPPSQWWYTLLPTK